MRIFEVLNFSANFSIDDNRTWYHNLYEPLIDLGHDVLLFQAEEGRVAMQECGLGKRADFSQKLLDTFRKEHEKKPFGLFFAYLMDGMVEPEVIDEIKKTGVPTCNFSCNNAHQFYLVDELSPHFDYNLHSERDTREKFVAIGANPLWWPMASNPNYFRPYDVRPDVDVSFVGANYALRARYIYHLLENGVDVHAYGPGWSRVARNRWRSAAKRSIFLCKALCASSPETKLRASSLLADFDFRRRLINRWPTNLHSPISDEDLIRMYSRSRISLGFLEVYDRHDPSRPVTRHLHLREFEAPMCGALYCTGYTEELEEFFEPDKEVIVYNNRHELLDKVLFYLSHEKEREKIRKAGFERALKDHTYHRRFEKLFESIGLMGRG
jgi:spore maturation protein CgeB